MIKNGCYGQPLNNHQAEEYQLPLKSLNYDIQLADSIACLELTQHYYNASTNILDVQYIFPVNPEAAIITFEVDFGDNSIRGVVKAKEEAEKEYDENQREGRGVAYGEISDRSRDLMRVKLGNVGVGQNVRIKLTFTHEVNISYNTFYEFRLSPTMTPRYVSTLPAEDVTFNKPNSSKALKTCQWNMRILVKSMRKLLSFFSTSHSVDVKAKTIDQYTSEIIITENLRPDRDFSLCYTFESCDKPNYLISDSDSSSVAAVSFIPHLCQLQPSDAKQHALNELPYPVNIDASKAEYLFMLDRSGSMEGTRIEQAKNALVIFLKSLPEDCYFNIINFGSRYVPMFQKSEKNNLEIIQKAIFNVQNMKANMGGTEIHQALQWIFNQELIEGYPQQIFLLTDGAVDKTNTVIKFVGENTHHARVHCIGIGNGCSEALINGCAKKGRGYSVFISDKEDPSPPIISLLEKSLSPVISKMQLTYDKTKVESIVPNPEKMPYILKNELANFYINFKEVLKAPFPLTIEYSDSNGSTFKGEVVIKPNSPLQCQFIKAMVNFKRIRALQNVLNGEEQEDHIYFVKQLDTKKLEQQIIKESVENQVLTDLTAFVCVNTLSPDQVSKANLKGEKQTVNINPMNPADHVAKVQFYSGDEDIQNSFSDLYINECYVQVNERAPAENKNYRKEQFSFKKKYPSLKMFSTNAITGALELIDGVDVVKSQSMIPDMDIIKFQLINGSWINKNILDGLYRHKDITSLAKELNLILGKDQNQIFWITFLVAKALQKMHGNAQYSMILKKSHAFLAKLSNEATLQRIYKKVFKY